MSDKDRPRRVDVGTVARGLRQGAEVLERPDVRQGVDAVLEQVGHGREHGHERHETPNRERESSRAPRPQPSSPTMTAPPVVTQKVDPSQIARDGFTCATPFSPKPADVVVVCCSSEKFELQHQEFIAAMGFNMPHFIQVPGGPASLYSLAAFSGFVSKAMGTFVHKAVELVGVNDVVLIAHEECGAYKETGRISVLGHLTRRLTGKGMKEAQLEHLQKASRELQGRLGSSVQVRAFYANLAVTGTVTKIRFEPVQL